MPVAGFVRLRRHQFGRQAGLGDRVPATRAYSFKGTPSVDLAWTDPDVDTGSIDPVAEPYRGPADLTASLSSEALHYNDLPLILSAFFGGGITPTGAGTAKTWTYSPASTTVDDIDTFTYEFGDDVLTDWYQFGDGLLESFEIVGPDGLGPVTASMSWRFGSVASTGSTDYPVEGSVPTALTVDPDDIIVYLKDCSIFIASSTAGLGAGQITNALHSFTLSPSRDLDLKRWANGDQSFDVDDYGVAGRSMEIQLVFAKSDDIVGTGSESDAWMSETVVTRFLRLTFTSTALAEAAIPYSWTATMPIRYYTREEGEQGGNSTVTLTGRLFYEAADLDGVFETAVVNTLTAAEFSS